MRVTRTSPTRLNVSVLPEVRLSARPPFSFHARSQGANSSGAHFSRHFPPTRWAA
jgi:hypothetical protein